MSEWDVRFASPILLCTRDAKLALTYSTNFRDGILAGLLFTRIIDFYEEPEEETVSQQTFDEAHWVANASGTLACAKFYRDLLEDLYGNVTTKYFGTTSRFP
jgi:hypothetical protein